MGFDVLELPVSSNEPEVCCVSDQDVCMCVYVCMRVCCVSIIYVNGVLDRLIEDRLPQAVNL